MFFFLSKLLTFLLSPLIWVFALLLCAIYKWKSRHVKRMLMLAISILYIFSNEFLCDEAYRAWEYPFTKIEEADNYDYAVLLGGFSAYDTAFSRNKFTEAGDRFIQTYHLYQQGKVKKIFITGGSGSFLRQEETEADKVKNFLISLKVPEEDVIMEKESRNTHENAVYTAKWLSVNDPSASCLLITSASHMPRAIGCFKKTNLNVTPYTTHRLTEPRKFDPDTLLVPHARNLTKWDILLKEMVGILIYRVVGYI